MASTKKRNKTYNPNKVNQIREAVKRQVERGEKPELKVSVRESMEKLLAQKHYANYVLPKVFGKTLDLALEGMADCLAYLIQASNPADESYALVQETIPFYDMTQMPFTWDILKKSDLMDLLKFSYEDRTLEWVHDTEEDNKYLYELREQGVSCYWTIQIDIGLMQLPINSLFLFEDICNKCKSKEDAEAFAKKHELIIGYESLEISPNAKLPMWEVVHDAESNQDTAQINRAWRDPKTGDVNMTTVFDIMADTIVNYLAENEGYCIFSLEAKLSIQERV